MAATLESDLGFFVPAFVGLDDLYYNNLYASNPNYDEARGPQIEGEGFVPIDEIGCLGVQSYNPNDLLESDEEYSDYMDRILTADADDPLGPNETPEEAKEAVEIDRAGGLIVNHVDPDYDYSKLGKPELVALFFEDDELTEPKAGTIVVKRKKTIYRNGKRSRVNTQHVVTVALARKPKHLVFTSATA